MRVQHAPAKINLGLHILAKRPDGFHDLETVFLPIGWADTLSFEPADSWELTCTDASIPVDDHNLILKTARLLTERFGSIQPCQIHLEKRIPHGAGLGGGSSDAATTLKFLVETNGIQVSDPEMLSLAARLGSDVPFFLKPLPSKATGRGEELSPLAGYTFPFELVVLKPAFSISTADAFGWARPEVLKRPAIEEIVRRNNLGLWREKLVNELEGPVFSRHPELGTLKSLLYESGAGYAAMSGSGSAVFGVFESKQMALECATSLSQTGLQIWSG